MTLRLLDEVISARSDEHIVDINEDKDHPLRIAAGVKARVLVASDEALRKQIIPK